MTFVSFPKHESLCNYQIILKCQHYVIPDSNDLGVFLETNVSHRIKLEHQMKVVVQKRQPRKLPGQSRVCLFSVNPSFESWIRFVPLKTDVT